MTSITEKMKEEYGEGDAIMNKIVEKECYKFYKHPSGFSLYRYDSEIEKEIALFTEQGSPTWHLTNEEMNGEYHEKLQPSGKFWHCLHLISVMLLGEDEQEKKEAQKEIGELEEDLDYHERQIVRSVWGGIQKEGVEFFQQEEIFKMLYAGEEQV